MWWKSAWLFICSSFFGVVSLYSPLGSLLMSACCLSTVDMALGIIAAHKLKKPITSKAFFGKLKSWGVLWLLVTCGIIAGPAFIEMGYGYYWASSYALCIYIFYELLSIIEKMAVFDFKMAIKLLNWFGKSSRPE